MLKRLTILIATATSAMLLSGCWESSEVTMHEPGAYMGKADPLLDQDAAARSGKLQERFQMVQIDR